MIDLTILTDLKNRDGNLNFNGLINHMQNSGLIFYDRELLGPAGLATLDSIYLNMRLLSRYSDRFVYFAILHEMAHLKRINKIGEVKTLELLSHKEFKGFMTHLITEEIIADRYASLVYYQLNKEIYPWYATQQLNLLSKQKQYENIGRLYFGEINNSRDNYNILINKFIIENERRE